MSAVRAFVAIELATQVRTLFAETGRAIVNAEPAWRDEKWVRPENLHITLKFLGNMDEEALDRLEESLVTVAASHASFNLHATGLKAVPGLRRCKMLWASFDDSMRACERLAADVDAAAVAFDIEPESRAFRTHVTLCRARRPMRIRAEAIAAATSLLRAGETSMSVASISLIASELTPGGPVYSTVETFDLRG